MSDEKKMRGARREPWLAENPETEVAAPIVLTHREAEQLQDMMENPQPRSPKFAEAMARHDRSLRENVEAYQSSKKAPRADE